MFGGLLDQLDDLEYKLGLLRQLVEETSGQCSACFEDLNRCYFCVRKLRKLEESQLRFFQEEEKQNFRMNMNKQDKPETKH